MPETDKTQTGRTRLGKSRMGGAYNMTTTRGGYGGETMMDSSTAQFSESGTFSQSRVGGTTRMNR